MLTVTLLTVCNGIMFPFLLQSPVRVIHVVDVISVSDHSIRLSHKCLVGVRYSELADCSMAVISLSPLFRRRTYCVCLAVA